MCLTRSVQQGRRPPPLWAAPPKSRLGAVGKEGPPTHRVGETEHSRRGLSGEKKAQARKKHFLRKVFGREGQPEGEDG